ncbi:hypothetical protein [Variovorax boronicumulans]|uniref:hypothetical protein n=1 Tax=Variovorax boronicumulans TaxID=436515 RepID=UPI001C562143
MMPLPGVLGLAAPFSSGAGVVTFRDAGAMIIRAADTTVAPKVPLGALDGDLLVAVIMRRSAAAFDPPSGWTLVSNAGPASASGVTQYTHVYTKAATGVEGGGAVTFTQAASGRIIGQIIAIAGSTGTPAAESQSTASLDSSTINSIAFPSISSAGNGRLAMAVGSLTLAASGGSVTGLSAPGWAIRSTPLIAENRMGIFTSSIASGESTSGTMTSTIDPTADTGATSNALIFAAP